MKKGEIGKKPVGNSEGIMLSAEDIRILELEIKIQKYSDVLNTPNITYEYATKIGNEYTKLSDEQSALLFDCRGNYRKDRRHLLIENGNYLDVSLLSNWRDVRTVGQALAQ